MLRNIVKSLLKNDAYPEPVTSVELVQTHVSYLFLTDTHVYKVKKPVDYGFLNFSTIDRRRFYCNEEVRLNRRLCPDIYEGVVELRETTHGAAFYGTGALLDYAVKMKRLPAERMLDHLVETGQVTADDLRRVAKVIAAFHRTAATSPAIAEFGRIERIMYNWNENFEQMVPFTDSTLPEVDRRSIRDWVTAFSIEQSALFAQRISAGFIRECDGDIHLENICLTDRVYIFDCIEFNERFRYCDTAADISFLLMDLDYHGRHDLSEAVIDEYVTESGDMTATGIIDFYKIYRAFVRGKVESFKLHDNGIEQDVRDRANERAIRYFRLARGYLERRRLTPTLFITCGPMGCGKSSLARQMAFELGAAVISSDLVRKKLFGPLHPDSGNDNFESGLYAPDITAATYAELARQAETELRAGRSVIVDASFGQAAVRKTFSALAQRLGIRYAIIHFNCTGALLLERLARRAESGSSESDGRPELLEHQLRRFETPREDEGRVIVLDAALPAHQAANVIYQGIP